MDLNDLQIRWLKATVNKPERKQNILVPGNQAGKTVVCVVKHLWHCFYKPYAKGTDPAQIEKETYTTLNISPNSNQVRQMYTYMLQILRSEFTWRDEKGVGHQNDCKIEWFLKKTSANPLPVVWFSNNSVFYCRSTHDDKARGLQGGQYAYISYDECLLSLHLESEIAGNIMSRLISFGGDIDLIGTPNSESPSNQYYMKIVKDGILGRDGWFTMKGTLDDNKFIPTENREKIKRAIKNVNPDQYRQVVFGDFVSAGSGFFSPDQVNNLFDPEAMFQEPRDQHIYVIGADWAVAKRDYTVFTVIDVTDYIWKVAHIRRFQGSDYAPREQLSILRELKTRYNNGVVIADAASMGGKMFVIEAQGIITYEFKSGGTGEAKRAMLVALKQTLAEQRLKCPDQEQLREELGTYVVEDSKIRQDMVMSLGMAVYHARNNQQHFVKPIKLNIFR